MPNTETFEPEVRDRVKETKANVQREIEEAREKFKMKAEDAWNDVVDLIRKHPGKAIGVAVGAGLLVGLSAASMRRRDSAADSLRGLAGTGVDALDRVKEGLNEAVCNLKDAFEEAMTKFK